MPICLRYSPTQSDGASHPPGGPERATHRDGMRVTRRAEGDPIPTLLFAGSRPGMGAALSTRSGAGWMLAA